MRPPRNEQLALKRASTNVGGGSGPAFYLPAGSNGIVEREIGTTNKKSISSSAQ